MMGGLTYRVNDDPIEHASFTSLKTSLSDRYRAKKKAQSESKQSKPKLVVGRGVTGRVFTRKPIDGYKSKYYDPVERHLRYLREKDHPTRPYGTGGQSKASGRGSGGSKGSKGSGKSNAKANQNISEAIEKLREESSLDTEAHREAAKRKIEDLREELKEHLEKLEQLREDDESTLNIAEIRGKIQSIREAIEATGADLHKWIEQEREALQRRIAKLKGEDYDKTKAEKQTSVENKDKEISSRADAIYKRKSKK